jgi:hypothetical protein
MVMGLREYVVMLMHDPSGKYSTPSFVKNPEGTETLVFATYGEASKKKAELKASFPQCWYGVAVLGMGKADDDRR